MLEIVHDLAPNAELGFATAVSTDGEFADNVRALRFQAGCDVLVDDILYFNESPFQDGIIARAVNDVTADGALYFSSAGNEGNTLDGTSGSYENDFADSGRGVGKFAGAAHDFDPGPAVQVFEPISADSSAGVPVTLFWADPLGARRRRLRPLPVRRRRQRRRLLAGRPGRRTTTRTRSSARRPSAGSGLRLAVVRFAGSARYFQLSALRGRFSDSADGLIARVTPGVTRGHSAAADAFSVAAAPAAGPLPFDLEPGDPPNPTGPFPNAFAATQLPERFTSDGPRRMFFAADGAPLAAVRQKPDITAADGVSTSLERLRRRSSGRRRRRRTPPRSRRSCCRATRARARTRSATRSTRPRSTSRRRASTAAPGTGSCAPTACSTTPAPRRSRWSRPGAPTVTPVTGDGDAFLEPGETATVALPVTNVGDGTATGVSVTGDEHGDPQAQLTPRTQSYGDHRRPATTTSRELPARAAGRLPARQARCRCRCASRSRACCRRPRRRCTIPTGQPAATATTFAYSGPPVADPRRRTRAGASVTIPVAGVGYASRLTFSIDGATCSTATGATTVGLDHTFVGDLVGTLTGPGGTPATLFSHTGGGGNNLCQVVFDDAAAQPFATLTSARAPFTGTWRPAEPLDPLLSAPVDGDWKFTVVDTAARDTGTIRAVSLHVTGFVGGMTSSSSSRRANRTMGAAREARLRFAHDQRHRHEDSPSARPPPLAARAALVHPAAGERQAAGEPARCRARSCGCPPRRARDRVAARSGPRVTAAHSSRPRRIASATAAARSDTSSFA